MFVVSQKPKKKSKFIIRTEASRIINPPQNIILNPQISKINTLNNQINKNIITQKNQGIIKKIFPKKPMFRLTFVRPSHNQNKHKIKNETKNNSMNNKIKTRRNNLSNIKYSSGRWKEDEHKRFIEAIIKYGNDWKQVQKYVRTRSSTQARSHAQKFFVKIKKAKILDFNLDLSKTSIKMFHDMIKEAPQEKYDKILSALNSVAFERGNNSEKKKREKVNENKIDNNNLHNNNIYNLKENVDDLNGSITETINPMNPTNDDANINYILSQLINNLADDNVEIMEHYPNLSARKISFDSNFDNKSYLSKRRKRSSISSFNDIKKGFNEDIVNDNCYFGSNNNNNIPNLNINFNSNIDMLYNPNEKGFVSLNNSRKVSQDEDFLLNVLKDNKKNNK